MEQEPIKIISRESWKRIKNEIDRYENQKVEKERKDKEKAKFIQESKDFIKNWTNCLKNVQNIHESRKHLKEDEDENLKKFIEEEKARRIENHQQIVKNAKLRKFLDTDQVKTFKMAINEVEVFNDRKKQVEEKNIQKELEAKQMAFDETFFEKLYRRSEEKALNQPKIETELRHYQEKQAHERKEFLKNEQEKTIEHFNKMLPGKNDVESFDSLKHQCQLVWRKELDDQISVNEKLRKLDKLKDTLQYKKNEFHQNKRIAINKELKRMQNKEFREKQRKLEVFGYEVSQMLNQKLEREKSTVAQAMEEQEKQERLRTIFEQEKRDVSKKEFLDHVQTKIEENTAKKQSELNEAMEEKRKIDQDFENYQKEIKEKNLKSYNEKRELDVYYQKRMEEEKALRNQEKLELDNFMRDKIREMLEEDTSYAEYTKKAIEEADQQGKCTFHMKKLAEKTFESKALEDFCKRNKELEEKRK